MKVLYFDCFSGISGDMTLGALLDAGLPLDALKHAFGSLAIADVHVHADRVLRAGVSATKFTVHTHDHGHAAHDHHHHDHHHHDHQPSQATPASAGQAAKAVTPKLASEESERRRTHDTAHHHRSLPEIFELIDRSALSPAGRDRAKAMFQRLAEAEAAIHQMPVEQVHLHEVGALDSILDVVGTVFALEWVGADRIVCSPLNVGGGMVQSAHGLFPVPAPATVKLLGDAPVYAGAVQKELVTPTGALIATTYASSFGPIPAMSVEKVGYGAGERDNPQTPNVLRVLIGRASEQPGVERVSVVECEIDDMNPQLFGVAMERLYAAGALEVFYTPVQMKKNRPGTLVTVVVAPDKRSAITEVIFRETTTIGLRHHDVERECLAREIVTVSTPLGEVRFKVSSRDGRAITATPEFEDCARLAAANNLAVRDVQAIALAAYADGGRP